MNDNLSENKNTRRSLSGAWWQVGAQPATNGNANGQLALPLSFPAGIPTPLYWYWLLIKAFWKQMLAASIMVVLASGLLQICLLPHWWQASAVLLPLTNETQTGAIANLVTSSGSNIGAELQGLLGIQNQAEQDADEYMAIVNGFEFSSQLIAGHRLQDHFRAPLTWRLLHPGKPLTPFKLYKIMQKRFECEWDDKNQVLNLWYSDYTKAGAERLLGYIISDLRERLRAQELQQARTAVDSLTNEVKHTTDYVLQAQLYTLIAGQIQAMDLAEMQADFSFLVVDQPFAPDMFTWPPLLLSSIALLVFTPCVFLAILILRRRAHIAAREYLQLVARSGSEPPHELSPLDPPTEFNPEGDPAIGEFVKKPSSGYQKF